MTMALLVPKALHDVQNLRCATSHFALTESVLHPEYDVEEDACLTWSCTRDY